MMGICPWLPANISPLFSSLSLHVLLAVDEINIRRTFTHEQYTLFKVL